MTVRIKRIRLLALDVDGVLTDGRLWWSQQNGWMRSFDIKDGLGLKLLIDAGIDVAWISSAAPSPAVHERAKALGVTRVFVGVEDKLAALRQILSETGYAYDEVAYAGDDLPDIPVLKQVGFAATVSDAVAPVKKVVHYVARRPGGRGAVREIADLLLKGKPRAVAKW